MVRLLSLAVVVVVVSVGCNDKAPTYEYVTINQSVEAEQSLEDRLEAELDPWSHVGVFATGTNVGLIRVNLWLAEGQARIETVRFSIETNPVDEALKGVTYDLLVSDSESPMGVSYAGSAIAEHGTIAIQLTRSVTIGPNVTEITLLSHDPEEFLPGTTVIAQLWDVSLVEIKENGEERAPEIVRVGRTGHLLQTPEYVPPTPIEHQITVTPNPVQMHLSRVERAEVLRFALRNDEVEPLRLMEFQFGYGAGGFQLHVPSVEIWMLSTLSPGAWERVGTVYETVPGGTRLASWLGTMSGNLVVPQGETRIFRVTIDGRHIPSGGSFQMIFAQITSEGQFSATVLESYPGYNGPPLLTP